MSEAKPLITKPLIIGIVAGESSGDQLGARLMVRLRLQSSRPVQFVGVGGPLMQGQGLPSLFPMSDIAVNGLFPVIARLPTLISRIAFTAKGIAAAKPDVVVHIDAQDFNKRVATKLKRLIPDTPLIGYVSPTVWAWRPWRARKIRTLYAKLLAVLPFEPAVHQRLGGPETVYVGHPLLERQDDWTRSEGEIQRLETKPYRLLVLPGSRQSEIERLLPLFGETVKALAVHMPDLEIMLPAVDHLADLVRAKTSDWVIKPQIILGEKEKWFAFRSARAALAASGTVTLELALAGAPTVVAYRVSWLEGEIARRMIAVQYASLPNIILDRPLLPEFIEPNWVGSDLAPILRRLMENSPERKKQIEGFAELNLAMKTQKSQNPSDAAAEYVLNAIHH